MVHVTSDSDCDSLVCDPRPCLQVSSSSPPPPSTAAAPPSLGLEALTLITVVIITAINAPSPETGVARPYHHHHYICPRNDGHHHCHYHLHTGHHPQRRLQRRLGREELDLIIITIMIIIIVEYHCHCN